MPLISTLKRLPIDLGKASLRGTTKAKLVALDFVPDGNARRALDIGCPEGTQSKWLEARGYKVTSVDIESNYSRCQVFDVNDGLPFTDESFDLIWCSEVIEHLVSPGAFIKSLFPAGQIMEYSTYFLSNFRIRRLVGFLSPTFVVINEKQAS